MLLVFPILETEQEIVQTIHLPIISPVCSDEQEHTRRRCIHSSTCFGNDNSQNKGKGTPARALSNLHLSRMTHARSQVKLSRMTDTAKRIFVTNRLNRLKMMTPSTFYRDALKGNAR